MHLDKKCVDFLKKLRIICHRLNCTLVLSNACKDNGCIQLMHVIMASVNNCFIIAKS